MAVDYIADDLPVPGLARPSLPDTDGLWPPKLPDIPIPGLLRHPGPT